MILIFKDLKSCLRFSVSVITRPDRIIQKKELDYPVKRLCRNYLKCEFVILNEAKNLTKSMRYKTEILRLGPQNDNCDTVSKPDNDNYWNRVRYE